MSDGEYSPVLRNKLEDELQKQHNVNTNADFNVQNPKVRVNSYWTEDFLIVIQQSVNFTFNNLYVWKWEEYQNPQYLNKYDLLPLYPLGLYPSSFFLFKNFMVLMPETGYQVSKRQFTSMIRVHNLLDEFKLIGSYDFPDDCNIRRYLKTDEGILLLNIGITIHLYIIYLGNEFAHLHRLEDKAVALCRTPNLTFYVFSLPNCQLLATFPVLFDRRPLDFDELDQKFLMIDNTMMRNV